MYVKVVTDDRASHEPNFNVEKNKLNGLGLGLEKKIHEMTV